MNSLVAVRHAAAAAVICDPLLLLAAAVATFDPHWNEDNEDRDEERPLQTAFRITRQAFPEIYAAALDAIRCDQSESSIDYLICHAISAKGIPIDDLEMIGWGIPLPSYGVDLESPEFYEAHADLLPILTLFGVTPGDDDERWFRIPRHVYEIGHELAKSLCEQEDATLQQVGTLFGWLFSCTGNTLVDCSYETLADYEPLSWSNDEIELAMEMIAEADRFMTEAMAGLRWMQETLHFMPILERAIAALRKGSQKGKRDDASIVLDWVYPDGGAERTAVADAVVF